LIFTSSEGELVEREWVKVEELDERRVMINGRGA